MAGLWGSGQGASLLAEVLRFDDLGGPALRVAIWTRALAVLQDFPLTGIGLGAFRVVVPVLYPSVWLEPDRPPPHAHNLFLQIGVDLGLPGLILVVALLVLVVWAGLTGWERWRVVGRRDLALISLAGTGSLAALVAHGLVDAVTWGTRPAFLAWAVSGIVLAGGVTAYRTPACYGPEHE